PGLCGLPLRDQAQPFRKGDLVAVVEPQEAVLHAGAGGGLFSPRHVFRRRRGAIGGCRPGPRRRGAGPFQGFWDGRDGGGGGGRGVLGAVVVLGAGGQPAAVTERLRRLLADRRRLLQFLQDRVDLLLGRDRLFALAGIGRQVNLERPRPGQLALDGAADRP